MSVAAVLTNLILGTQAYDLRFKVNKLWMIILSQVLLSSSQKVQVALTQEVISSLLVFRVKDNTFGKKERLPPRIIKLNFKNHGKYKFMISVNLKN